MVVDMNINERSIIADLRELHLILTVEGISTGGREKLIEPQRLILTNSLSKAINDLVELYNK